MPNPFIDVRSKFEGLQGSRFFSTIDLKNGYHQMKINPCDTYKTSFTTIYGQFEYLRVPFGLVNAPRAFVNAIQSMFNGIDFVRIFIDDVLIFSKTYDEHIKHLKTVFDIMQKNNLSINFDKSVFCVDKVKYLGLIIDCKGIKPDNVELEKINKLVNVKNKKDVMRLVGFLNFYRSFIVNMSKKLLPITDKLSTSTKFYWGEKDSKIIKEIFKELANNKVYFPNYKEEFHLFTDASDLAVGGVVYQKNGIVKIFSKKLNHYQRNYTIMEKELLAIILSLEEFRNMIIGYKVNLYTDNKNITYLGNSDTKRIQRWKLILEEYNLNIKHVSGKNNQGADFLSRIHVKAIKERIINSFPKINKIEQEKDDVIKKNITDGVYIVKENVIVDKNSRIVVPEHFKLEVVRYFHEFFAHPGIIKLYECVKAIYNVSNLRSIVNRLVVNCIECRKNKSSNKKYGQIKGDLVYKAPFDTIVIDIYGPVNLKNRDFYILTAIDMCTRWVEFFKIKNLKAEEVFNVLFINWFKKYPLPRKMICDNGRTFIAKEFLKRSEALGIKVKYITPYNPTSNSICERVHSVLGNVIRINKGKDLDEILALTGDLLRSTYHSGIGMTPMKLIFNREKFNLKVKQPEKSEMLLKAIESAKNQALKNKERTNAKRIDIEFNVGDLVLIRVENPSKFDEKFRGPYEVVNVFSNSVEIVNESDKKEIVNIKRVLPFKKGEDVMVNETKNETLF